MQNSSVYLFHELLPIFVSLYAFMSVILLHNILIFAEDNEGLSCN